MPQINHMPKFADLAIFDVGVAVRLLASRVFTILAEAPSRY